MFGDFSRKHYEHMLINITSLEKTRPQGIQLVHELVLLGRRQIFYTTEIGVMIIFDVLKRNDLRNNSACCIFFNDVMELPRQPPWWREKTLKKD